MEAAVWSDPQVLSMLRNDFVIVPLYVIMDAEGNVVNQPTGTNMDVQSYLNWLKAGLN